VVHEVVTGGALHALKGVGSHAFHRWLVIVRMATKVFALAAEIKTARRKARRAAPTQKACKRALANHDNGTSMIRQKSLASVSVVAGRADLHKHNVTQNKERGHSDGGTGARRPSEVACDFFGGTAPACRRGEPKPEGRGLDAALGAEPRKRPRLRYKSAWGSSPGGRDARGASRLDCVPLSLFWVTLCLCKSALPAPF
jgi:hypothetical protein